MSNDDTATVDFETRSYADLKKTGAWAYSEDPTTDTICSCHGIGYEPIQEWNFEEDAGMPDDLRHAVKTGCLIEAHNVAFERSVWQNVMVPKYGWILPKDEQWRDTMAVAAYYALPLALDRLAYVLGFEGKDRAGVRLISKYSKLHLKSATTIIPPEDLRRFIDYCIKDVMIEQAVSDELGDLPDRELPIFLLDQKINMRGINLDIPGIMNASKIVEQRSAELTKKFRTIVGYNPTQNEKVKSWLEAELGFELDNMQKDPLQELLDGDEVPQGKARQAIEIRLAINKASTKKLDAMSRNVGANGRARFQTRYHGAATGRWTGSGFQPLNLTRGYESVSPEQLVRDIGYCDASWLDTVYGDAMEAVSKASRHWIQAAPGNIIFAGDFSSIEAVILAALAGEEWKIKAFADGVKIYEHMADKIYGLAPGTVTKATHPTERQDGKTGELAFGYQGALGAWLKFDSSGRHTDERIIEICQAWRAEHPQIVNLWHGLQAAAIEATRSGDETYFGEIGFEIVDEWLTMILPNGKRLWYRDPYVKAVRPHWCKPKEFDDCADGSCKHYPVPQLSYMSQKEGQWRRVSTYGGKLTENACQAVSREILVPAMQRVEDAGYHVILNVYDELVCEIPKDFGSIEEFEDLMAGPLPDWAEGWPVRVDAWQGDRYKK